MVLRDYFNKGDANRGAPVAPKFKLEGWFRKLMPPATDSTEFATLPIIAPTGPPNTVVPAVTAGEILLTTSNPFSQLGPFCQWNFVLQ